MQLTIKAQIQIAKTPQEVYDAVINPEQMSNYFIAKSSGPMEAHKTVQWKFPEFDMQFPVRVGDLKPGEYISFYWDEGEIELLVEMNLLAKENNSTHIIITEKGMESNEAGIAWYGRNSEGWANFLACLKAWMEYGINLRKGAFDFMKGGDLGQ